MVHTHRLVLQRAASVSVSEESVLVGNQLM